VTRRAPRRDQPLFAGDGLARALFDSMPVAAVVLDEGRRVRALNRAAEDFLGVGAPEVLGAAEGEVLRCVNALRDPGGCGRAPECGQCLLRQSAEEALQGGTVRQRQVRVRVGGPESRELALLLSAAPLSPAETGARLALVLIQDVTDLHQLRGLLPICAGCKKIRREDQAWEAIEAFLERHSLAEFTHGLCPQCLERLDPEQDPET